MMSEKKSDEAVVERLEALVERASDELTSLRERNAELEEQLAENVERIEKLESAQEKDRSEFEQWSTRKDEIEDRLQKLVSGLEGLLDEDD